ncbi:MAG: hypothetical protein ACPGPS_18390, partial [Rubripirellula sp.]
DVNKTCTLAGYTSQVNPKLTSFCWGASIIGNPISGIRYLCTVHCLSICSLRRDTLIQSTGGTVGSGMGRAMSVAWRLPTRSLASEGKQTRTGVSDVEAVQPESGDELCP